jgi:hypothetical protein
VRSWRIRWVKRQRRLCGSKRTAGIPRCESHVDGSCLPIVSSTILLGLTEVAITKLRAGCTYVMMAPVQSHLVRMQVETLRSGSGKQAGVATGVYSVGSRVIQTKRPFGVPPAGLVPAAAETRPSRPDSHPISRLLGKIRGTLSPDDVPWPKGGTWDEVSGTAPGRFPSFSSGHPRGTPDPLRRTGFSGSARRCGRRAGARAGGRRGGCRR